MSDFEPDESFIPPTAPSPGALAPVDPSTRTRPVYGRLPPAETGGFGAGAAAWAGSSSGTSGGSQMVRLQQRLNLLNREVPELARVDPEVALAFVQENVGLSDREFVGQAIDAVDWSIWQQSAATFNDYPEAKQRALWSEMDKDRRSILEEAGANVPDMDPSSDNGFFNINLPDKIPFIGLDPLIPDEIHIGANLGPIGEALEAVQNAGGEVLEEGLHDLTVLGDTFAHLWRASMDQTGSEKVARDKMLDRHLRRLYEDEFGDVGDAEWRSLARPFWEWRMANRDDPWSLGTDEGLFGIGSGDSRDQISELFVEDPVNSVRGVSPEGQQWIMNQGQGLSESTEYQTNFWASWKRTGVGEQYSLPRMELDALEILDGNMDHLMIARQLAAGKSEDEIITDEVGSYEDDPEAYDAYAAELAEALTVGINDDGTGNSHLNEAVKILTSSKSSPGRDLVRQVGLNPTPGTSLGDQLWDPANLLSGAIDMAQAIFMDPTLIAGRVNKSQRALRYGIRILNPDDVSDTVQAVTNVGDMMRLSRVDRYRRGLLTIDDLNVDDLEVLARVDQWSKSPNPLRRLVLADQMHIARQQHRAMERLALAFQGDDVGLGLAQLMEDMPRTRTGIQDMLGYHHALINERGIAGGLADPDMVWGYMANVDGRSSLFRGGFGGYQTPTLMELPRITPLRQLGMNAKSGWNHFIDFADSNTYKHMKWLQAENEVIVDPNRMRRMIGKVGDNIGRFGFVMTRHLPFDRAIALADQSSITDMRNLTNLGQMLGMDQATRQWWQGRFINALFDTPEGTTAAGEAGRRLVVQDFVAELGRRTTGFNVGPAADDYINKLVRLVDQNYAPAGIDQLSLSHLGPTKLGILFGDQAEHLVLPAFADLEVASRKLTMLRRAFGVVNNETVDAFMGRAWKPAVLLRIGFIPRAAGEELLNFALRKSPTAYGKAIAAVTAAGDQSKELAVLKPATGLWDMTNAPFRKARDIIWGAMGEDPRTGQQLLADRWKWMATRYPEETIFGKGVDATAGIPADITRRAADELDRLDFWERLRFNGEQTVMDAFNWEIGQARRHGKDDDFINALKAKQADRVASMTGPQLMAHVAAQHASRATRRAMARVAPAEYLLAAQMMFDDPGVQAVYARTIGGADAFRVTDVPKKLTDESRLVEVVNEAGKPLYSLNFRNKHQFGELSWTSGEDIHTVIAYSRDVARLFKDPMVAAAMDQVKGFIPEDLLQQTRRLMFPDWEPSTVRATAPVVPADVSDVNISGFSRAWRTGEIGLEDTGVWPGGFAATTVDDDTSFIGQFEQAFGIKVYEDETVDGVRHLTDEFIDAWPDIHRRLANDRTYHVLRRHNPEVGSLIGRLDTAVRTTTGNQWDWILAEGATADDMVNLLGRLRERIIGQADPDDMHDILYVLDSYIEQLRAYSAGAPNAFVPPASRKRLLEIFEGPLESGLIDDFVPDQALEAARQQVVRQSIMDGDDDMADILFGVVDAEPNGFWNQDELDALESFGGDGRLEIRRAVTEALNERERPDVALEILNDAVVRWRSQFQAQLTNVPEAYLNKVVGMEDKLDELVATVEDYITRTRSGYQPRLPGDVADAATEDIRTRLVRRLRGRDPDDVGADRVDTEDLLTGEDIEVPYDPLDGGDSYLPEGVEMEGEFGRDDLDAVSEVALDDDAVNELVERLTSGEQALPYREEELDSIVEVLQNQARESLNYTVNNLNETQQLDYLVQEMLDMYMPGWDMGTDVTPFFDRTDIMAAPVPVPAFGTAPEDVLGSLNRLREFIHGTDTKNVRRFRSLLKAWARGQHDVPRISHRGVLTIPQAQEHGRNVSNTLSQLRKVARNLDGGAESGTYQLILEQLQALDPSVTSAIIENVPMVTGSIPMLQADMARAVRRTLLDPRYAGKRTSMARNVVSRKGPLAQDVPQDRIRMHAPMLDQRTQQALFTDLMPEYREGPPGTTSLLPQEGMVQVENQLRITANQIGVSDDALNLATQILLTPRHDAAVLTRGGRLSAIGPYVTPDARVADEATRLLDEFLRRRIGQRGTLQGGDDLEMAAATTGFGMRAVPADEMGPWSQLEPVVQTGYVDIPLDKAPLRLDKATEEGRVFTTPQLSRRIIEGDIDNPAMLPYLLEETDWGQMKPYDRTLARRQSQNTVFGPEATTFETFTEGQTFDEVIDDWADLVVDRVARTLFHRTGEAPLSTGDRPLLELIHPMLNDPDNVDLIALIEEMPTSILPQTVIGPLKEHAVSNFWDRMVRFGFDDVIGPAIGAIIRTPLFVDAMAEGIEASSRLIKEPEFFDDVARAVSRSTGIDQDEVLEIFKRIPDEVWDDDLDVAAWRLLLARYLEGDEEAAEFVRDTLISDNLPNIGVSASGGGYSSQYMVRVDDQAVLDWGKELRLREKMAEELAEVETQIASQVFEPEYAQELTDKAERLSDAIDEIDKAFSVGRQMGMWEILPDEGMGLTGLQSVIGVDRRKLYQWVKRHYGGDEQRIDEFYRQLVYEHEMAHQRLHQGMAMPGETFDEALSESEAAELYKMRRLHQEMQAETSAMRAMGVPWEEVRVDAETVLEDWDRYADTLIARHAEGGRVGATSTPAEFRERLDQVRANLERQVQEWGQRTDFPTETIRPHAVRLRLDEEDFDADTWEVLKAMTGGTGHERLVDEAVAQYLTTQTDIGAEAVLRTLGTRQSKPYPLTAEYDLLSDGRIQISIPTVNAEKARQIDDQLGELARIANDPDVALGVVPAHVDESLAHVIDEVGLDTFNRVVTAQRETLRRAEAQWTALLGVQGEQFGQYSRAARFPLEDLNGMDMLDLRRARRWKTNADKPFTDALIDRAVNDTIHYIDDHRIRSVFQQYVRNLSPFWFAQEQFLKRWARTIKYAPESIRRGQLMMQGLRSSGVIHEDEFGNEVWSFPLPEAASNFLASTPALNWIFGEGASIPVSTAFTGQVQHTLPGMESLARLNPFDVSLGPIASIPLGGLASVFPELKPFEEFAVGPRGTDRNLLEQLLPTQVSRVADLVTRGGRYDDQIASLSIQAMQMMAAEAQDLRLRAEETDDPDERADLLAEAEELDPQQDRGSVAIEQYQDRVRNWARRMLTTKTMIGFVSPASPQIDLPTEMDDEFSRLLEVYDFNEAVAIFLRRNPNGVPYTVSGTTRPSFAEVPITADAFTFYNENRDWMEQFPQAGAWFLPQSAAEDEFERRAYYQQLATGLRERKSPEEFYVDLKFALAADQYFGRQEERDIMLAEADTPEEAAEIQSEWDLFVNSFRQTNPIFAEEIEDRNSARKTQVLEELHTALNDPNMPEVDHAVHLKAVLDAYDTYQDQMVNFEGLSSVAADTARSNLRQSFAEWGIDYVARHPEARTLWRALIIPVAGLREVVTNYSRTRGSSSEAEAEAEFGQVG